MSTLTTAMLYPFFSTLSAFAPIGLRTTHVASIPKPSRRRKTTREARLSAMEQRPRSYRAETIWLLFGRYSADIGIGAAEKPPVLDYKDDDGD
jgi:hypothetical protein